MMREFKIVGFTSYDSAYLTAQILEEEFPHVFDLVVEEIKKNGYCFSGEDHQNHERTVPIFANGTVLRCSMRLWAQMMAEAHNGDKNSYMDFYMDVPGESIYPEEETKVKPAETGSPYAYLADRDVDLMMETVMVGIDTLMTTDKAILSLWPTFKTYIQNQMKQKQ